MEIDVCPFCDEKLEPVYGGLPDSLADPENHQFIWSYKHPDCDCILGGMRVKKSQLEKWNRRGTPLR